MSAGPGQRVLVLNGPNLGRLGSREPDVYGSTSYAGLVERCTALGKELGLEVEVRETNDEGEMIRWLHEAADGKLPVVINPGAFTHYSYAIRDAASQRTAPLVEVHISNRTPARSSGTPRSSPRWPPAPSPDSASAPTSWPCVRWSEALVWALEAEARVAAVSSALPSRSKVEVRAVSDGHYQGSLPEPTPGPPRATLQLRAVPEGAATGHFAMPDAAPPGTAQPHPQPQGPVAVLLIGPAGAGKTSVARYWADHRATPTAHISLDDVREWVRSGFANPQSGWNDNSEAQYRLARRTCGFAARNYFANGISCIIDDAVFPDSPAIGLGGWKRHVGPALLPVVLLPGLDVVLARNAERTGVRRLADEEVARIHGRMAGWYGSGLTIIDNSRLDVAGTAAALDQVVTRAMAQPLPW